VTLQREFSQETVCSTRGPHLATLGPHEVHVDYVLAIAGSLSCVRGFSLRWFRGHWTSFRSGRFGSWRLGDRIGSHIADGLQPGISKSSSLDWQALLHLRWGHLLFESRRRLRLHLPSRSRVCDVRSWRWRTARGGNYGYVGCVSPSAV